MQAFTKSRDKDQDDELWMVQHPPVFTLGKAAAREHVLDAGNIPVLASERGGQVTYHGPG
ncbi:MAG: octanoyltransferase, partial [Betaproteobacteria bacterium]|nr:octanoyltransferase [Betaproteobacteria bacterium]